MPDVIDDETLGFFFFIHNEAYSLLRYNYLNNI